MASVTDCLLCNRCSGAAYGWPPILYAGRLDSPILIVAQNPGDFYSGRDPVRLDAQLSASDELKSMRETGRVDERWVLEQYAWDFGDSYGARQLAKVFGADWLAQCCYTNAVLCRTPDNAHPSEEMKLNCRHWTLSLIESHERKLIVTVGAVAKQQVVPRRARRSSMSWGTVYRLSNGVRILPITHYSAWRHVRADIPSVYRTAFQDTVTRLRIPYLFD